MSAGLLTLAVRGAGALLTIAVGVFTLLRPHLGLELLEASTKPDPIIDEAISLLVTGAGGLAWAPIASSRYRSASWLNPWILGGAGLLLLVAGVGRGERLFALGALLVLAAAGSGAFAPRFDQPHSTR